MVAVGQQDVATADTLTLDGQSGSNTYDIYTSGSRFGENNYTLNVLGTHAPTDGTDTLNIYGYDEYNAKGEPEDTGEVEGGAEGDRYETNDIFLLRSTKEIVGETAAQPALYSGTGHCEEPASTPHEGTSAANCSGGAGFVALLHTTLAGAQGKNGKEQKGEDGEFIGGETESFGVERINYDSSANGGLHVYSLGGNDYFAVDDNAATTYLDGGAGDNTFQIGQIFGLQRTKEGTGPYAGNLASENIFEVATVATTEGWLSRGTSSPLTAIGGPGDNTFIVYSNQAVVRTAGRRRQRHVHRARLRARGNQERRNGPAGRLQRDCRAELPADPKTTNGFSTAANTEVRTGGGDRPGRVQHERPGVGRRRRRLQPADHPRHRIRRPHRHHRSRHLRRRRGGHLHQHPGDRRRRAAGR